MERDYAAELDALQEQLKQMNESMQARVNQVNENMQALLRQFAPQLPPCATGGPNPTVGHVEKMAHMHPDERISTLVSDLEDACGADGSTGRITCMGVFASGGRQSTWVKHSVNTDELLGLIENRTAEKVLACIGSNDRLNMLLAILRKPRTVAELVSDCGFSSTGQAYHHLKPLIAADLIVEDKAHRGTYIVQPHRVQGVMMLLAGIADLVDGTYTQGQIP